MPNLRVDLAPFAAYLHKAGYVLPVCAAACSGTPQDSGVARKVKCVFADSAREQ